jgi:hypothetical protein
MEVVVTITGDGVITVVLVTRATDVAVVVNVSMIVVVASIVTEAST